MTQTLRFALVLAAIGGLVPIPRPAAQGPSSIAALVKDPTVKRAIEVMRDTESQTISDQIRLCETPAPPFQEDARGELLRRAFEQLGLQKVHRDPVGNIIGERPGTGMRPHVMVAAHLDTVFPPGTVVAVRRTGTRLSGPGIGDNCRGLAVLIAIIRAMRTSGVRTPGPITFVANVGEEGLGDLRGMKELFGAGRGAAGAHSDVDRFLSIDGPGLFMTTTAVGSHRYRVTFKGPGGHSYAAFGTASPIGALGRAVARINDLQVPDVPRTTFSVGRIGGGTSVNAIPFEAWMEVDLRSADPTALAALDARVQRAVDAAVSEENARWRTPGVVTVTRELVGDRPGGSVPSTSPVLTITLAAADALGVRLQSGEASTDANLPLSLGIPAVTIGGGGVGDDAHALTESFDGTDAWKGAQHALLVTIGFAQP